MDNFWIETTLNAVSIISADMGYKHCWAPKRRWTQAEWDSIIKFVRASINAASWVRIGDASGAEESQPVIHQDRIELNGIGGDGCTPFILHQISSDPLSDIPIVNPFSSEFHMCKTRLHKYDDLVTAILAGVAYLAPDSIIIESDGAERNWEQGLKLASKILGETVPFPIKTGVERPT